MSMLPTMLLGESVQIDCNMICGHCGRMFQASKPKDRIICVFCKSRDTYDYAKLKAEGVQK